MKDNVRPFNSNGKVKKGQIMQKCVVPDCNVLAKENAEHGMCPDHEKWLKFLLWVIPKIQVPRPPVPIPSPRPPSGLVVPK